MAEENQEVINDVNKEVPEVNETEDRARAQGWVPKEEWNGEGRWRDAESFLDRGELFGKIDSQRRQIKQLEATQQEFTKHLSIVRQAEFKRAMDQIRKEKKDALIEGDPDAVIRADEKLVELNNEANRAVQAAKQGEPASTGEAHPEFVAWTNRNSWYESSKPMRAFADALGQDLQAEGGRTPAQILKEVETQVRKEFPNRFTNPNREKAGAVEGGSGSKQTTGRESFPLSDDERRIMNSLVKSGALTKEQYIADLKAVKER